MSENYFKYRFSDGIEFNVKEKEFVTIIGGNNDLIVYLQKNLLFISDKLADLLFIRLDKNRNGNVFYREVEDELQTVY